MISKKHLLLVLIQITVCIRIPGSLTEFLPVQDMGSSKNFASSSISNDYCAYGVIRGRRLGGCLLSLNASGSCKCLSCLQIAEWGAV